MRALQRKVEAAVGGKLLQWGSNKALKESKLAQKSVFLPKACITLHYLERCCYPPNCKTTQATITQTDKVKKNETVGTVTPQQSTNRPCSTLLFCHGLSDEGKNLSAWITSLKLPDHVRILVPDTIGHGKDLDRVWKDPKNFQQPTPTSILEATIEFLDIVCGVDTTCNAFGYSMGAALVYFLRIHRPEIIDKTLLVSPSFESCIDDAFINDFLDGKKNHFCFESRQDVKLLFRDLSLPNRRKKDPIPKFFLEAIFREQHRMVPQGHYRKLLMSLLQARGKDPKMVGTDHDIDPDSPRVVIWPKDDFICDYEKGKAFFNHLPLILQNFLPF